MFIRNNTENNLFFFFAQISLAKPSHAKDGHFSNDIKKKWKIQTPVWIMVLFFGEINILSNKEDGFTDED